MSERWIYQIKTGGFWGVFMTAFNLFFELKDKTFMQQVTTSNFYIRAIGFILMGIFVLGYFNWKQKMKRQQNQ
ncbi:MAG: hypothetical protein ACOYBS_09955 [Flavobacterium sp.]